MSLNVKLVVVGGDVKTTEIELKLPSTIGRGRGTTIVLPHPLVSRQHCELFEVDGQLMVKDLGSLNGTFVNNERVSEAPIAPDELLTVGTVTFRAVYESEQVQSAGPGRTLKSTGDKTVKAPHAAKLAPAKPTAPAVADSDSGPLEFNFDEPLLPVDEVSAPAKRGNAPPVTERLDATMAQDKKTKPAVSPAAKRPAQPAAGKRSTAHSKSKGESDQDEGDQDEGHQDKVPSASDDDLNDFLESLGNNEK